MPTDPAQHTLTRRELYDLVWSTPLKTLAQRFGTTGTWLAKVCDQHEIPRPGTGHWTKRDMGRAPDPTPLPPAATPDGETVDLTPPTPARDPVIPPAAGPTSTASPPAEDEQAPAKPGQPPEPLPRTLTRAQLHELVWSTPMQKLAPRFGCSDVWLTRLCKDAAVPTPPRGYWAKKLAGRHARKLPLPRSATRDEVVLEITPVSELPPRPPPPPPPPPNDPDVDQILAALGNFGPVDVAADLSKPHPVIALARRALRQQDVPRQRDQQGSYVVHTYRSNPLAMEITDGQVDRALRIFDALFRSLDRLGFKTRAPDQGRAATVVLDTELSFHVREIYRQVPFDPKIDPRHPMFEPRVSKKYTGRFVWTLQGGRYRGSSWKESVRRPPIEKRLVEIVRATVLEAQDARRGREAQRQAEIRRREEEIARWREEEARRAEQQRVDKLIEQADRWEKATRLRRFIDARRAASLTGGDADVAIEEWIRWAAGVADRIDPLASRSKP